jgi:hypothetical protein
LKINYEVASGALKNTLLVHLGYGTYKVSRGSKKNALFSARYEN